MAGSMKTEPDMTPHKLRTSREPVGPKRGGDKGTIGDMALKDAVMIVVIAWLIVFSLGFSLRRHSI